VILAIIVAWILCAILTASNAIPNDPVHWSYHARTDVKISVLHEANWFRFPYPCMFFVGVFGELFSALYGSSSGVQYYRKIVLGYISIIFRLKSEQMAQ